MPKTIKAVIAALAIIILGAAAYNYFAFADERRVQQTLLELREKVSAPLTGEPDAASTAAALKPFFTPKVNIFLQLGGELSQTFDRDDLLRVIIDIKRHTPELTLKLDFSRGNIKITEGRTATVSVLATFENPGETFKPRQLIFTFEKEEALWRLAAVGEQ